MSEILKGSSRVQQLNAQPIEDLRPNNTETDESEVNEYAALLWMEVEKEISLGQLWKKNNSILGGCIRLELE